MEVKDNKESSGKMKFLHSNHGLCAKKSFNLGGNVRTVSITVEPNGEAPICKGEEVGDDDAKTKSDEAEEEEEEEDDDDGEGVAVAAGNWQQRAGAFLDRNEIKFKANKNNIFLY